jgi:hypothetical protein
MEENGCSILKEHPQTSEFSTNCMPPSVFWGSDPVSDDEHVDKKSK